MKNKISELMDGELDAVDTEKVISALKRKDDLLSEWETYHVISDALRYPAASLPIDVTRRVSDRLINEPILLAPRALSQLRKRKLISLSAAASFAVLVSGWLMMQTTNTNTQQETLVAENVNNKAVVQVDHPLAFQPSSAFTLPMIPQHPGHGDYSLIHRGFSPHTMMYAPVMSVHQIEDEQEIKK